MRVVGFSGGLSENSRTQKLVHEIVLSISNALVIHGVPVESKVVALSELAPQLAAAVWRQDLTPEANEQLDAIEHADIIVIATPVYRTSYPGLFKHALDFIDRKGLEKKLVVLGACGGSQHHSLIIEHQLRPLLSNLGAFTAPTGIYTEAQDFSKDALVNANVFTRIEMAVSEVLHFVGAEHFGVNNTLAVKLKAVAAANSL